MDLSINETSQLESFKVENEQLKHKLEKNVLDYELKIQHLKDEIDYKKRIYDDVSFKINELDEKFKNSCKEKIEINQQLQDITEEKFNIVKSFNNLETEHSKVLELISRRENELVESRKEIDSLKKSVNEYHLLEIQLKVKDKDFKYLQSDFERIEENLKRNNKRLTDRVKELENKLQSTTSELFETKSIHDKTIYELNLALDRKRNEYKTLNKTNEKLRQEMTLLEKVKSDQAESLRTAIESQTNIDNVLRNEIQVQKSLAELYKEERDECVQKEKKLIDAITELQSALKESCNESDRVKNECENRLKSFAEQLETLKEKHDSTTKELESANELIDKFRVRGVSEEELRAVNPSTAVAIGALKRGYSITQIYSEYQQVVEERDEIRVERDRLNEYLKNILDELEQKAPLLKEQRDEHTALDSALNTVTKKYDETLEQLLLVQSDCKYYREKYEFINKDLQQRDQECRDLSHQVCCLLRDIETTRGTVIRSTKNYPGNESDLMKRMIEYENGKCNDNTAHSVITNHLVTFKNIIELQQQNQKLIQQIRILSENQENMESLVNENNTEQLAKKLDDSFKEIRELRDKLKEQKELDRIVEQQRHIIQALSCVNEGGQILSCLTSGVVRQEPQNQLTDDTKQLMAEFKEKYESSQMEIKQLYKEKEDLRKQFSEHKEQLQNQMAELKVVNSNLLSKVTEFQNRSKSLEQNLLNRQLELNDLQQELFQSNQELEEKSQQTKSFKQQLLSQTEARNNLEYELNKIRNEYDFSTNLQIQLDEERKQKQSLLSMQNLLSEQIQSLKQLILEPRHKELQNDEKLELKAEIRGLNLQLKQEKSKYETSMELWKSKLNEAHIQVDSLQTQLNTSQISMDTSQEQVSLNNTSLKRVSDTESDDVGLTELKNKNELEKSIDSLSTSNENLQKQIVTFKELLEEAEKKINSNTELIEEMNSQFEEQLDSEKKKNSDLQEELSSLKEQIKSMDEDYKSLENIQQHKTDVYQKKLSEKETIISELKSDQDQLNTQLEQLKKDLTRLQDSLTETTENYHQQLIFHAQDSEELKRTTEELKKYEKQDNEINNKLEAIELERDELKVEYEKLKRKYEFENSSKEKDLEQVKKERAVLLEQMSQLTDRVVNLKKIVDPNLHSEIDRSIFQQESDWNDVIKYLREEKESAEKRLVELQHEVQQMQSMHKLQQNQILELENMLQEEKSLQIQESETQKKHAEVMRELEQLEMTKESNAKLREDRMRLQRELELKQKKIDELRQTAEPNNVQLKAAKKKVEELEVDVNCLEKERNHWRQMSNNLISRLNQVNPEEFKKICTEKQELVVQVTELESNLVSKNKELDENIEKLEELQNQREEMKTIMEKIQIETQNKDSTIAQLKEIGRRYKSESAQKDEESTRLKSEMEKLKDDITKSTESLLKVNEELSKSKEEFIKVKEENTKTKEELSKSKIKIQQLITANTQAQQAQQAQQQQSTINKMDEAEIQKRIELEKKKIHGENQMRNSIVEKKMIKLTRRYDKVVSLLENAGIPIIFDEESDETPSKSSTCSSVPTVTITTVPMETSVATISNSLFQQSSSTSTLSNEPSLSMITASSSSIATTNQLPIARVTASVQPTSISKPLVSIATTSSIQGQQQTPCIMGARQTVEIRPIPIITPQSSAPILNESSITTTTSISSGVISESIQQTGSSENIISQIPTTTTTSLPANVVQALSTSSLFSVSQSATSSTTVPLTGTAVTRKRPLQQTDTQQLQPQQASQSSSSQQQGSDMDIIGESSSTVTSTNMGTTNLFTSDPDPMIKKARFNLFGGPSTIKKGQESTSDNSSGAGFGMSIFGSGTNSTSQHPTGSLFANISSTKTVGGSISKSKEDFEDDDDIVEGGEGGEIEGDYDDELVVEDIDDVGDLEEGYDEDDGEDGNDAREVMAGEEDEENDDIIELSSSEDGNHGNESRESKPEDINSSMDSSTNQGDDNDERKVQLESKKESEKLDKDPNQVSTTISSTSDDVKQKIQPIIWTDPSQMGSISSSSSTSAVVATTLTEGTNASIGNPITVIGGSISNIASSSGSQTPSGGGQLQQRKSNVQHSSQNSLMMGGRFSGGANRTVATARRRMNFYHPRRMLRRY